MIKYFFGLSLFCCAFVLNAHEEHTKQQSSAVAVSVAFDAQGNLWRALVHDGFLQVSKSVDAGQTFSKPTNVNHIPHKIGADGEARPKVAISPEGYIYLTWTEALKKPFAGYIWFARSIDAGKTFETPYIVHQDRNEITHRFDSLNVGADGKITVTWVDKRDLFAAKAANQAYEGAAIYYAVSENKGVSFSLEQKLADSSCECCRIALTNKPDGTVVAMWRHVFEGSERDHMIAEIPSNQTTPQPKRATFGRWKIDGCPHHGAALASGGEGERWWGYHMAWFDGGNDEAGEKATLYYARMDGEAWVSSPSKKFGNMKKQAGHPALAAVGDNVWLVWREKDAGKSQIWLMKSDDEGKSWGTPTVIADTTASADYPILLQKNKQVFLMWNTSTEGLKAVAI
ncbi:MAG: sialidase family protein [Methylotenera sp.]|uniref:sialidase family protein n=1 Tax=Methylotenera sp. TaxID=2051956 RepID=UPI002717148B|nr:sialidase family protein [Methylotenera sp.]MDO9151417.1 sialidase family protein [Methylotenera sp.]